MTNGDDISQKLFRARQYVMTTIDNTTPFKVQRWAGFGLLMLVYVVRVLLIEGWYIVTYALGIYLLNLFLAFLSPKLDPALESPAANDENASADEDPALPTQQNQEFKPFIRKLPEFKFWYRFFIVSLFTPRFYATRAVLIAFFCTFFSLFDIPVYWPILLMYFILLFALTMKRQIKHMIKYRYVPFDVGSKKSYK